MLYFSAESFIESFDVVLTCFQVAPQGDSSVDQIHSLNHLILQLTYRPNHCRVTSQTLWFPKYFWNLHSLFGFGSMRSPSRQLRLKQWLALNKKIKAPINHPKLMRLRKNLCYPRMNTSSLTRPQTPYLIFMGRKYFLRPRLWTDWYGTDPTRNFSEW